MVSRATKPATPAAVAEAQSGGPHGVPTSRIETAPTVPPPDDAHADARLPEGTMISDRYRVADVLGEGGMGVVYRAEHVLMRKEVAVKVLHADMCSVPEVVERFEREAITAAHIEHPNVAGATDFGRLDDGSCYLVLELLRGVSLRDEIAKGPMPLPRALRLLRGIASGVGAAHAKGIVHRDLKPENVMLIDRDGTTDFVKVLDFGIAKVDTTVAAAPQAGGKVLTRVGAVFGTPEYMSPEQAVGDTVDARADLYALGVIFLEMLTGKCPFQGKPLSILRERILAVGPPDMSEVTDPGAKDIITRLLTRQPDDRMQTATELVAAIDNLLGDRKGGSLPPPSGERGTNPPPVVSGPALPSSPPPAATTGATAETTALASGSRARWIIPVAAAAAIGIMVGAFGFVSMLTKPHAPPSGSTAIAPSSSIATPQPSASASPTESSENPTASAQPPAVDLDEPTPPAPTASAASARATPRPKPVIKPKPQPKKGGINIPPPKDWIPH